MSVLLLVVSLRRYSASRLRRDANADLLSIDKPSVDAGAPWVVRFANTVGLQAGISDLVFRAPVDRTSQGNDPATANPPDLETRDVGATTGIDTSTASLARDAVLARIARDPASAQGLIELVRALYLDGSNFTFRTIADLRNEDRTLATALVEAWLADPSATDDWQQLYDAIREQELCVR